MIDFITLVNLAIETNKEYRKTVGAPDSRYLGLRKYLKEQGTVKLNIGRRTGKTSYIRDHAGPEDLVIVHNGMIARNFGYCLAKIVHPHIFPTLAGIRAETIWVDEPMLVKRNLQHLHHLHMDSIYDITARHEHQTYVFLGE